MYCSNKPHIEGFLRKKIIPGIKRIALFLFCVWYTVLKQSKCALGERVSGSRSLIDATISQFLGDIVEYNPSIFPSTVNSVLKLVTFFFAAFAQYHKA